MDITLVGVVLILLVFSIYSHLRKKLNKEGIFLAVIVGLVIFINGSLSLFLTTILVFMLTTIATNIKEKTKAKVHHKRTTKNILANLGLPTIFLLLGSPLFFLAGISASLSDTMSSEIGLVSKRRPRLITTLKLSRAGVNGAITPLGTFAGTIGASIIAIITYFLLNNIIYASLVLLAGIIGTITDSFLGATIENKGIINNAQVNTISVFIAVMVVFVILNV